jgi:class 3 adenylate cyclase
MLSRQKAEYDIVLFNNPKEFYNKLISKKIGIPDVIITDILMPQMSGVELAFKIREKKEYDDCILVSSSILSESIDDDYQNIIGFDIALHDLPNDIELHVKHILEFVKNKLEKKNNRYSFDNFHQLMRKMYESRIIIRELEETYIKKIIDPNVYSMLKKGRLKDGWKREIISVGFVDIRGYTELSARMDPENLAILLNNYVQIVTNIVIAEGGSVDKFIGDAVMWTVGGIIPNVSHQITNIKIAKKIMACLPGLEQKVSKIIGQVIPVQCGIGLSTGYMDIGLLGRNAARMQFTVIGSHVNIAARLASIAQVSEILIGGRIDENLEKDGTLTYLRDETIKGFKDKVRVFKINI